MPFSETLNVQNLQREAPASHPVPPPEARRTNSPAILRGRRWETGAVVGLVAVVALTAVVAVAASSIGAAPNTGHVEGVAAVKISSHHPHHAVASHHPARPASVLKQVQELKSVLKEADVKFAKKETVVEETVVKQAPETPLVKKPYQGKLNTRAFNGSLICETPECSRAAALIVSSLNVSVDPCSNFYEFACGGWIGAHPAPPSSGTFYQADDLLTQRLQLLLETPAKPSDPDPLFLIRRFYESCMDTDTMDSLGLAPLWTELFAIGGWPMVDDGWDPASYSTEAGLASIRDLNFSPMLGMGIDADLFNTSRKIIYVGEGSMGISESVLAYPDDYPIIMTAYRNYITESAKQFRDYLGTAVTDTAIEQDVESLVNFEIALAQLMQASGAQNLSEIYELTDVAGVQALADFPSPGNFNFLVYLRLIFGETDVIIEPEEPVYLQGGPTYIKGLSTLLGETMPRTLANYMAWMWVLDIGTETTYAMRNISDRFIWVYTGGSTPYPRWYFCTEEANYNLGFSVSRAYVDEFFPAEAKAENEEMVEDLRSSFDGLLDANTWLSAADTVTAKEKLQAVEEFVAYPDWIMDDASITAAYEGLTINNGEQFANLVRIGRFIEYWDCESLRLEPRSKFVMPPTVVNAFYSAQANSITILAGILQIPFYQHNSLAALNYGGIGMVIGHELTHGFDNSGRNFDKDGNLALWWSQESIDAFNVRAQCFVDQYDNFHPPEVFDPSVTVNGQQTLGENIADNGGLREAFQAYQKYVERYGEEPRLPGLDEFSPDQLFYLSNANVWCESKTEGSILNQLAGDPHSPGRFRILGPVSNDANFASAWGCPAGSPMNRGDESCVLW